MRLTARGQALRTTIVMMIAIVGALFVIDLLVWGLSALLGVQNVDGG